MPQQSGVLTWQQVGRAWLESQGHFLTKSGYPVSPMETAFYDPYRYKLVLAGEGAGKSYTGALYAAARWVYELSRIPERYLLWIVGQDYESAYREFDLLQDFLVQFGVLAPRDVTVRDQGRDKCWFTARLDDRVLFAETITGGEPSKVARLEPHGILGCEVGQWTHELFLRVFGRLARKGGWLWGSGTFEGSTGWLPLLWRRWQADNPEGGRSYSCPTWTNAWKFPGGEQDPEIQRLKALYPPYRFQERFGAVPCAPAGTVFDDFFPTEHVSGEAVYNPQLPLYLAIDPGYRVYAVLAIQVLPDAVHVVDEVYERGLTAPQVIKLCARRPWGQDEEGRWRVVGGTIDVAGTQHQGLESHEEVWAAAGIRLTSEKIPVQAGIDRVRTFLRAAALKGEIPRLRINPSCRGLISEMGGGEPPFSDGGPWRYKVDKEGNTLSDEPEKTNCDSAKALAYFLVSRYGYVEQPRQTGLFNPYHANTAPSWFDWFKGAPL